MSYIVNDYGEKIDMQQLHSEMLDETDVQSLEELAYEMKRWQALFKNVESEVKLRLARDPAAFEHVRYGERKSTVLPDTQPVKELFAKEFGIDAFELKSPTKLRKQFGASVEERLAELTETTLTAVLKYD